MQVLLGWKILLHKTEKKKRKKKKKKEEKRREEESEYITISSQGLFEYIP